MSSTIISPTIDITPINPGEGTSPSTLTSTYYRYCDDAASSSGYNSNGTSSVMMTPDYSGVYDVNNKSLTEYCATNPRYVKNFTFKLKDRGFGNSVSKLMSGALDCNFVDPNNGTAWGCSSVPSSLTSNATLAKFNFTKYNDYYKIQMADPASTTVPIPAVKKFAGSAGNDWYAPFQVKNQLFAYGTDIALRADDDFANVLIMNANTLTTLGTIPLDGARGLWLLLQAGGGGGGGLSSNTTNMLYVGGGGGGGAGALVYVDFVQLYCINASHNYYFRIKYSGGGSVSSAGGSITLYYSRLTQTGNTVSASDTRLAVINGGKGGSYKRLTADYEYYSGSADPAGGAGGTVTTYNSNSAMYIAKSWSGGDGGDGSIETENEGESLSDSPQTVSCSGDTFYLCRTLTASSSPRYFGQGSDAASDGHVYGGGGGGSTCADAGRYVSSYGQGGRGRTYGQAAQSGGSGGAFLLASTKHAPAVELADPVMKITSTMSDAGLLNASSTYTIINNNPFSVLCYYRYLNATSHKWMALTSKNIAANSSADIYSNVSGTTYGNVSAYFTYTVESTICESNTVYAS